MSNDHEETGNPFLKLRRSKDSKIKTVILIFFILNCHSNRMMRMDGLGFLSTPFLPDANTLPTVRSQQLRRAAPCNSVNTSIDPSDDVGGIE
mmetsp:Transcript_20301/g.40650  ORF Transcript_20301/g.40650 Transcript_20301/m.40650 type:complete len:92 (+) Transcript_20301:547-822(+)